jgi:hypothetical protein
MSKSVGTNTDPLTVEIYVENGLIKGRIQMDEPICKPIIECNIKTDNIEIQCEQIYTINSNCNYNFIHTNIPLTIVNNSEKILNDKYEYFHYIEYMKQYNIIGSRREIYNHYCRNKSNIMILDYDLNASYTNALLKILNLAKNNNRSEIMIIFDQRNIMFSNIHKYNSSIKDYDFINAKIILSPIYVSNHIADIQNITIRSECYDELISSLSLNNAWIMCFLNYIEKHLFEVLILDYNLFEKIEK